MNDTSDLQFFDEDVDQNLFAPPLANQRSLARAVALRARPPLQTPTSGVETPPPQPDYRATLNELLRQAAAQPSDTDVTAQRDYAKQRNEKAQRDFERGMVMQVMGGSAFKPIGEAVLRQALVEQGPEKIGGGIVSLGQFFPDPELAAQRRQQRLEGLTRLSISAESLEQRREAARQADATRRELAQEPLVQVYDPNTQSVSYVPRSQAAGMQAPPRSRGGVGGAGRQLSPSAVNQITADETKVAQFSNLLASWKPEYGGLGTSVGNLAGRFNPLASDAQRAQAQWWQNYQEFVNDMRHGQFGSALTPTEKAEFEKAIVVPNTDPRNVAVYLERQQRLAETARTRRLGNFSRAGFDVSGFDDSAPGAPQQRSSGGSTSWDKLP